MIFKNVPSKQLCVPFCHSGWEQGIKITISLSLEEKAPIVQFYRLESFITVEATYTSPTAAQDHAITLLLLKMHVTRYSHRVALHLHLIHKFFSVRYDTIRYFI